MRKIDIKPYKTLVYDFLIHIGNVQAIGEVHAGGAMAISVTQEELKAIIEKGRKALESLELLR